MRVLFQLNRRNKRAVSNVVAYVLLIAITIALSILVFNWLKFYVDTEEDVVCPAGISISIDSYSCDSSSFDVTVKNKGRFTIDGYILRVHNRSNADFGIYELEVVENELVPAAEASHNYPFNVAYDEIIFEEFTLLEVQPFVQSDDVESNRVLCSSIAKQSVTCIA